MEGDRRETTDDSERSGGSSGEESREATGISACSNEKAAEGNSADNRASRTEQEPQSRESVKLYSESGWQREASSGNDERWRRPASRDYSRVIHSPSFRRLQGKTQVFPVTESDFFRNRLTHSLEVAQIAEGIAQKLNYEYAQFSNEPIDERLCVTAALIHDLGHPPFGHNGERALDDVMRPYGGFEGNAQTIRIIAKVEKKLRRDEHDPSELVDSDDDPRVGLALTYRTILSALKYDRLIPHMRGDQEGLVKGYYFTERQLIERAKFAVDPEWQQRRKFKTLECSIMDIADDIAYSTFDLEDSLKAGFITPAAILATDESVFARVAAKANKALPLDNQIDSKDALGVFLEIFSSIFSKGTGPSASIDSDGFIDCYKRSVSFAEDGYVRTALSSELVGKAIRSVKLRYNDEAPWLSEAYLPPDILKKVEVLKHFTFESTIFTARVKVGEYRGYEVVKGIFKALAEPKGSLLMPEDLRAMHKQLEHDATARHRAICDFVAGMTDRYALEFYARLYSDEPESIFKPV